MLSPTQGVITTAGLEENVDVCLEYLESWIRGTGCIPVNHKMEVSRSSTGSLNGGEGALLRLFSFFWTICNSLGADYSNLSSEASSPSCNNLARPNLVLVTATGGIEPSCASYGRYSGQPLQFQTQLARIVELSVGEQPPLALLLRLETSKRFLFCA